MDVDLGVNGRTVHVVRLCGRPGGDGLHGVEDPDSELASGDGVKGEGCARRLESRDQIVSEACLSRVDDMLCPKALQNLDLLFAADDVHQWNPIRLAESV